MSYRSTAVRYDVEIEVATADAAADDDDDDDARGRPTPSRRGEGKKALRAPARTMVVRGVDRRLLRATGLSPEAAAKEQAKQARAKARGGPAAAAGDRAVHCRVVVHADDALRSELRSVGRNARAERHVP